MSISTFFRFYIESLLKKLSLLGGILFWLAGGFYMGGTITDEIIQKKRKRNLSVFSTFIIILIVLINNF